MKRASGGASPPEFSDLRKMILETTSIAISKDDDYFLEARLRQVLEKLALKSYWQLVEGLKRGEPGWMEQVIDAVTTHETFFFRDMLPFNSLRDEVLPRLIRTNETSQTLKFLFVGCSSGQEPYSVSIILKEHFPQLDSWEVDLHGTDISGAIIQRACEGRYTQFEVNRGLPAPLLLKYFRKKGLLWQLNQEMIHTVRFSQAHLLETFYSSPKVDVLFLRNVLIYFSERERCQAWKGIENVLRPGGFIFLGAAETPIFQSSAFTLLSSVHAPIYQLKEKHNHECD